MMMMMMIVMLMMMMMMRIKHKKLIKNALWPGSAAELFMSRT